MAVDRHEAYHKREVQENFADKIKVDMPELSQVSNISSRKKKTLRATPKKKRIGVTCNAVPEESVKESIQEIQPEAIEKVISQEEIKMEIEFAPST